MKKQSSNFKFNNNYKITAILLAVALLCFAISGTVTLAKYINKEKKF